MLTNKKSEDKLPPTYASIVRAPKRIGAHQTVQLEIEKAARKMQMILHPLQICLTRCFTTLRFQGNNMYKISNRALLFMIILSQTFSATSQGLSKEVLLNNKRLRFMIEAKGVQASVKATYRSASKKPPLCCASTNWYWLGFSVLCTECTSSTTKE